MSRQKDKFELFSKLRDLGFTYDEAQALRRIEMTLSRWSELECGDEHGRCIERDEKTNRPYMTYDTGTNGKRGRYPVADREAGALKRLAAIVLARNSRATTDSDAGNFVLPYHQTDPRGCSLYLITREQLGDSPIDSAYNRGLAVCV